LDFGPGRGMKLQVFCGHLFPLRLMGFKQRTMRSR
jgi:hypothetical protein